MCNLGATVEIGCHNCAAIDPLSGVNEPGAVPAVRVFPSFLLLLLIAAAPALAQQEPPARVGRVGYASGDSVVPRRRRDRNGRQAGGELSGRDRRLVLDRSASRRAEIGIGPANDRLAGDTEIDIVT